MAAQWRKVAREQNLPDVVFDTEHSDRGHGAYVRFEGGQASRMVFNLSRFEEVSDRRRWKDLLLHEIAHVIAGPWAGHGVEWKRVAERLGVSKEHFERNELFRETQRQNAQG